MDLDYKPSEGFVVSSLEPLDEADVTPSDEFWLFQYPISRVCLENENPFLELHLIGRCLLSKLNAIDLIAMFYNYRDLYLNFQKSKGMFLRLMI